MTAPEPAFPDPAHDHRRCAVAALRHAEAVCAAREQALTPLRRRVFEALAAQHKPLGAYEIMDQIAEGGRRPAPITVYRALEFLMQNGLVHRIESRNAFLACTGAHDAAAAVAFLLCDRCGSVGELPAAALSQHLVEASRRAGFSPKLALVEVTGTCAHCLAD